MANNKLTSNRSHSQHKRTETKKKKTDKQKPVAMNVEKKNWEGKQEKEIGAGGGEGRPKIRPEILDQNTEFQKFPLFVDGRLNPFVMDCLLDFKPEGGHIPIQNTKACFITCLSAPGVLV